MDTQKVAAVVREVGRHLRADGADLLLLEADPKTDRIRLQLVLDAVSCAECVLLDMLLTTIDDALHHQIPGEFELILLDPRRQ